MTTRDPDRLVQARRLLANPGALGTQVGLYHSAVQIGVNQTAARSTKIMQKHNALARRLLDRQHDYLRFTQD